MQGRTVELATCLVQGSGVLMLVSPGQAAPLIAHLQKYILYGDEVRCDEDGFLPSIDGVVLPIRDVLYEYGTNMIMDTDDKSPRDLRGNISVLDGEC